MASVLYAKRFATDLELDSTYLAARGELRWIEARDASLAEITATLTHFPQAGTLVHEVGSVSVRRIRLGRTPLFVWYAYFPLRDEVRLLRLFHARQRRPVNR